MAVARRTHAVSRDEVFGQQIAVALRAAGLDVALHATLPTGAGAPDLWVVHVDGPVAALRELRGAVPIIAIVTGGLAVMVEALQANDRVVAVLDATDLDSTELTAVARRIAGDGPRYGAAQRLAAGSDVHVCGVTTYEDKQNAIAEISAFAATSGIPESQCDAIEQAIDELVMNALYAAPVDARGRPLFERIGVRRRIVLRTDQQAIVAYGIDATRLVVAVRDVFGRFGRGALVRHLDKGLHARDKVDRKAGGAGLGLYLLASSASTLSFTVTPGSACEATVTFLRARRTACELDFVELPAEGAPRSARVLRTPAARAALGRRIAAIVGAAALVAACMLAPPFPTSSTITLAVTPSDASVLVDGRPAQHVFDVALGRRARVYVELDGYEPVHVAVAGSVASQTVPIVLRALPLVELDTDPTDAAVTIDGVPMGRTPLNIQSLVPGAQVAATFDKPGYTRLTGRFAVPERGSVEKRAHLVRDPTLVRVRIESTPPGADVVRDGDPETTDHVYTPADVYVEAGAPVRFTLSMRGYQTQVVEVVANAGADGQVASGTLVPTGK
jgi:hypothetical protein